MFSLETSTGPDRNMNWIINSGAATGPEGRLDYRLFMQGEKIKSCKERRLVHTTSG